MQLERLIAALAPTDVVGDGATEIRELAYDAREVPRDSLFFCVPGARADGHEFAAEALDRGAATLVVERRLDLDAPQLVVPSVRAAMPRAAAEFFEDPTARLPVAAITGTNGKTTTPYLLWSILTAAGEQPGLLTNVERRVGGAGRCNGETALAAAAAAGALGIGEAAIKQGIAAVERVPGRFERVDEGQPFTVLVDYAHAPGALETVLEAAREFSPGGRLICVFGAGGDRDRAKRPLMGRVVAELADISLVTSDNPRSEDPAAIAAEVVDGLDLEVELDRRRAIERALDSAQAGDVVVIAGKGHEQGQEAGGRKVPFDDREVAREALRRLAAPT